MISFLKKIFKARLVVKKPKEAEVLVYEETSLPSAKILFNEHTLSVISVRYEEINLYVLLKSLLSNPVRIKQTYIYNYVKCVKPKIIYSCIDNHPTFYKLKNLINNATIVSDQKSIRDPFFFNLLKKEKKKLKCDISFVFTENEIKELSKYIDSSFYLSGPFYNNTLPKINTLGQQIRKVIFISGKIITPNLNSDKNFLHEKKLFLHLSEYCKKNSLELFFKEKNLFYDRKFDINSQSAPEKRKVFFEKHFGTSQNWNFIPHDLDKNSKLYKELFFENNLIVFSDSTLGYEFLSRGFKCVSFTDCFPIFGCEHLFKQKGEFWTNSLDYIELENLIDKVISLDHPAWEKIYKKHSKNILPHDKDNEFKKSVLKNFLY